MSQQEIPIATLPRQEFSIRLNNRRWTLRIVAGVGIVSVTITRDDVVLIENVRAVSGRALLPYDYQTDGNFAFATANDELPWWENFGNTCRLIYDDAV